LRLIESGIGCVTFNCGGWGMHSDNYTLRRQVPDLNRAIGNLIQNVHDRGMQGVFVVVCWGEFGRIPRASPIRRRTATAIGRTSWRGDELARRVVIGKFSDGSVTPCSAR
jgi:hypothetical protein